MTKISIKGTIISDDLQWIYDAVGVEGTSPQKVISVLNENPNKDITLEINSPGGDVFAGSEIYTALKQHKGKVIAEITAMAASAATVIMCGADKVYASPTSQIMIHNVSSYQRGDHNAMKHTAGILEGANKTIANAYVIKTGRPLEEFLKLMDVETWYTPQAAVEVGLIDGILFTDDKQRIETKEKFEGLKGGNSDSVQAAQVQYDYLKLKSKSL